ncbi:MAG: hypothetical protein OHK0018_03440 [Erythrobacter tepidarius]
MAARYGAVSIVTFAASSGVLPAIAPLLATHRLILLASNVEVTRPQRLD